MRKIFLTQGQVALVDDEYYEGLIKYQWIAHWNHKTKSFYADATVYTEYGKITMRMHRMVMNITVSNIQVDHRDHDTLNNQKFNLRLVTNSQNQANRRPNNPDHRAQRISIYKGVNWSNTANKWVARIQVRRHQKSLGSYDNELDAAKAYNRAAKMYFGEFAYLNEIPCTSLLTS